MFVERLETGLRGVWRCIRILSMSYVFESLHFTCYSSLYRYLTSRPNNDCSVTMITKLSIIHIISTLRRNTEVVMGLGNRCNNSRGVESFLAIFYTYILISRFNLHASILIQ